MIYEFANHLCVNRLIELTQNFKLEFAMEPNSGLTMDKVVKMSDEAN